MFELAQGGVFKLIEEEIFGREQRRAIGIALVDFPATQKLTQKTRLVNRTNTSVEIGYTKRSLVRPNGSQVKLYTEVPKTGSIELQSGDVIRSVMIANNTSITKSAQGEVVFAASQAQVAAPPVDAQQLSTVYVNQTNKVIRLSIEVMVSGGRTPVLNTVDLQPGKSYTAQTGQKPVSFALANGGRVEQRVATDDFNSVPVTINLVEARVTEVANGPAPDPDQPANVEPIQVQGSWSEFLGAKLIASIVVNQDLSLTRTTNTNNVSTGAIDAAKSKLTLRTSDGRVGNYQFQLDSKTARLYFIDSNGQQLPNVYWERGR